MGRDPCVNYVWGTGLMLGWGSFGAGIRKERNMVWKTENNGKRKANKKETCEGFLRTNCEGPMWFVISMNHHMTV